MKPSWIQRKGLFGPVTGRRWEQNRGTWEWGLRRQRKTTGGSWSGSISRTTWDGFGVAGRPSLVSGWMTIGELMVKRRWQTNLICLRDSTWWPLFNQPPAYLLSAHNQHPPTPKKRVPHHPMSVAPPPPPLVLQDNCPFQTDHSPSPIPVISTVCFTAKTLSAAKW